MSKCKYCEKEATLRFREVIDVCDVHWRNYHHYHEVKSNEPDDHALDERLAKAAYEAVNMPQADDLQFRELPGNAQGYWYKVARAVRKELERVREENRKTD